MRNFAIYVDSGANIPNDIRIARDIRVIPFHYTVEGEEYPCFSGCGSRANPSAVLPKSHPLQPPKP